MAANLLTRSLLRSTTLSSAWWLWRNYKAMNVDNYI
jgi:hypothetical protein